MNLKNYQEFIQESAMGSPEGATDFVEQTFENPEFKSAMFDLVTSLSSRDAQRIKDELASLGITPDSDPEEIAAEIQAQSDIETDELQENLEDKSKKIGEVLHDIGAANVSAWAGVPAAIAIGALTGMPLGFAISWGATAVLMGLAKMLGHK